jgi:GxxExxY protein
MSELSLEHDLLAGEIVDAGFAVHSLLGPGLLELAYEQCLAYGHEAREILYQRQAALLVLYRNHRIDIVAAGLIVIEAKPTENILAVHEARFATDLRLSGLQLGFPTHCNIVLIKYGITRRGNSRRLGALASWRFTVRTGARECESRATGVRDSIDPLRPFIPTRVEIDSPGPATSLCRHPRPLRGSPTVWMEGPAPATSASVRTRCPHGASPCPAWSQDQESKVVA